MNSASLCFYDQPLVEVWNNTKIAPGLPFGANFLEWLKDFFKALRCDQVTEQTKWQPIPYKQYKWIAKDPELLGGKLAIRGTMLSVFHVLECLAKGWTKEKIDDAFGALPPEALEVVLFVAAELAGNPNAAA